MAFLCRASTSHQAAKATPEAKAIYQSVITRLREQRKKERVTGRQGLRASHYMRKLGETGTCWPAMDCGWVVSMLSTLR